MDGLYDELRATLHAIWLRRWIALGVAWAVALAGWLVVSQIPNSYESTARILVQLRSILPTSAATGAAQADQARDIDRVRQTLTSAVNLEKVVRGTALADTVTTDRDVANRVASLQKQIKITAQQDNLFEISASLGDPKLAQAVVQKTIDLFVEDNLASGRNESSQSLRFLDEQIALRQKQLADAEARRQDFQARYMSMLPGTGSIDERMNQARAELAQIDSDLAAATSSLSAVNAQLGGTAPSIAGAGGTVSAGPARARVAAIEGQIAEGRGRGWTDQHPDMIALNRQLATARAAARGEPLNATGGAGGSPNPLYLQLRSMQTDRAARVAELNQRKSLLEGQLNQLQTQLARDPAAAAEQAQVDRDIAALRAQYDQLFADREQVRLRSQAQSEADAVKFSVIDPPTLAQAPTKPNRPLLLFGVLIAALGAGVAAAFALSQLQTRFATAARLQRTSGMTVIGSIGEVVSSAALAHRRKRLRWFAGGAGGLVAACVALVVLDVALRGLMR